MSGYDRLIAEAVEGNKNAFEEIYRKTNKKIYFTCLSFLKNEQDAADVTQDVYITVLQSLKTINEPSRFEGWICRIAVNKCKDFLKKKRLVPVGDETLTLMIDSGDNEILLPEDYLNDKEKRKIIMQIIGECLSDTLYQTVLLFYFHDMSAADIADLMDCPVGTVTSRLCIARAKIKKGVENYEKKNNDKLYSVVPIPILGAIIKAHAEAIESIDVWENILSATSDLMTTAEAAASGNDDASAVKTGGKTMLSTLKGKILAGIIAVIVVTAGITAAIMISKNAKDKGYHEEENGSQTEEYSKDEDHPLFENDDIIDADSSVTTTTGKEETTPVIENPVVADVPEEIPYRMAQIYKGVDEDGMTDLWYTVEILSNEWISSSLGDVIDITYNKTGQPISELDNINAFMNDELFIEQDFFTMGNICLYDHVKGEETPEEYENLLFPEDRTTYTFCISSNRDIDFDDFSIVMNLTHYPSETKFESKLEFNADISEMTTSPEVIHGGNLFEIDGYYYVVYLKGMNRTNFDYGDNIGNEDEAARVYRYFEVKCINGGSAENLVNSLKEHIQLVYGSESGYYQSSDFENPDYLMPIEIETGYHIFVEVIDSKDGRIAVGFEAEDGKTFQEGSERYNAIAGSLPLYTSDNGKVILFALDFI